MIQMTRRACLALGLGLAAILPGGPGHAAQAAWEVLTPEHPLWTDGLEGAVLVMPDNSYAMLLLRPEGDEALVSLAYPGTPHQEELISALEMPDGGVSRLKVTGDALVTLPPPREGFTAYGFVISAEDFSLLQAGLNWRLITTSEEMVFPLKGSRVAIEQALALRLAAAEPADTSD